MITSQQGACEQMAMKQRQHDLEQNVSTILEDDSANLLQSSLFTGRDALSQVRFSHLMQRQKDAEQHMKNRGLMVQAQHKSLFM